MPQHKGGKGGTRKFKRNEAKCKHYRAVKSIPNKRAKLKKHLTKHPTDLCAQAAQKKVGKGFTVPTTTLES